MKSIYASKLYRASKRKDHIKAALINSSNAGLVQQLSENLDEEYQKMNAEALEAQKAEEDATKEQGGQSSEEQDENGVPKSLSSGLSAGSFNPATDLMPFPEGEDGEVAEGEDGELPEGDITEGDSDESPSESEIEESTEVMGSVELDDGALAALKGDLNLVDGLSGVTRIVNKDGEIWIYYNDDTNLNNIMTDVIEHVIRLHPNLEFNRLARSDNAIVFEITAASSNGVIQPKDEKQS